MLKCYVLCRKDLAFVNPEYPNPGYPYVQGAHALAQLYEDGLTKDKWKNEYLIFLGVENEDELKKWMYKFDSKGIEYSHFIEPDVDYELTSIALISDGKLLSSLELMSYQLPETEELDVK